MAPIPWYSSRCWAVQSLDYGILVMNGASLSMYLSNRGTATLKGTSSARQVWNGGTLTLLDTGRIAGLEPHGGYATYLGVSNRGTLTRNDMSRNLRLRPRRRELRLDDAER